MRVFYGGNIDPTYARNRILIYALKQQGFSVDVRPSGSGESILSRSLDMAMNFAQERNEYDHLFVGTPGYMEVPVGRLLASAQCIPLVFDAHASIYDTQVLDRKSVGMESITAVYKKRLDQILVDIAHMTLVDTNETKEFFVDEVGANPATIYPVHHGTDERIFYPREHPDNGQTTIWFHGTYIPLQGVEYIVEAAKLLEDRDIKFVLVGSGQERSRIDAIIDNHDIDNIVQKDWVPYEDLPNGIAQADICLGIFGTTGKTNRVVPNKVYEYMSMGKPVITGDTTAMRRLFEHRKNVLLCNRGDPASIADAITTLLADSQLRVKLGRAAHERYQERFSSEQVGKRLISILKSS